MKIRILNARAGLRPVRQLGNGWKPLLLFIYIICILPLAAQPMTEKAIDQLVANSMKTFDVPGMAVAIVKDGKVILEKGYGVRSMNAPEKIDQHSLFAIASNSKAFTAAAIAILVDRKVLKWDDRVIDYIPEFRLYSPYVTEEFTVRDLLCHRSGLGLGSGDLMIFPDGNDYTVNELIHNMRYLKPVSSFRSKYDYNNLLFIVAGEVVKRASGLSWNEFIEQNILTPLEMKRTGSNYLRIPDKTNIVDPHAVIDGKLQIIDRHVLPLLDAAGGIYSSVHDLSKWVLMQLNEGNTLDGKQIFTPAVQRDMWSPQTIVRGRTGGPYNSHFVAYGLGWSITDVAGYGQLSHTGGLPGIWTQITLIPELKLGIIVLTNQQCSQAFSSVTDQIKDSYLKVKGVDRVKTYNENFRKSQQNTQEIINKAWAEVKEQQAKGEKTDITPFLGTYKDNWFGEVTIAIQNGKPWFTSKRSPKLTGELVNFKGNTMIAKWTDRTMEADAYVIFDLDYQGEASGFKMKWVSPATDFSYDFHDLTFTKIK